MNAASVARWDAQCGLARAEGLSNLVEQEGQSAFNALHFMYAATEIKVMRIDRHVLVGWPGSLSPHYVDLLKKQIPEPVFVAGHVNGHTQGDILDPAAEARGEFGAMPSPLSATGAERMVESTVALINDTRESGA